MHASAISDESLELRCSAGPVTLGQEHLKLQQLFCYRRCMRTAPEDAAGSPGKTDTLELVHRIPEAKHKVKARQCSGGICNYNLSFGGSSVLLRSTGTTIKVLLLR